MSTVRQETAEFSNEPSPFDQARHDFAAASNKFVELAAAYADSPMSYPKCEQFIRGVDTAVESFQGVAQAVEADDWSDREMVKILSTVLTKDSETRHDRLLEIEPDAELVDPLMVSFELSDTDGLVYELSDTPLHGSPRTEIGEFFRMKYYSYLKHDQAAVVSAGYTRHTEKQQRRQQTLTKVAGGALIAAAVIGAGLMAAKYFERNRSTE